MDGYALRAADVPAPGTRAAGQPAHRRRQRRRAARAGHARRASSPARRCPRGADAVVMQEQCSAVDGGVRVDAVPRAGQSIRRRGEDVAARRASCCAPGMRLTPQALGMAASVGAATLQVGAPAARGAVLDRRRAGDAGRAAQARRDLQLEPLHAARPDRGARRASTTTSASSPTGSTRPAPRCERAAEGNDLIVTCGGVSVGEEDHLRPAVEHEGRLDLWQIAIKPGKPLAFGEVFRADGSSALVHRPAGQSGVALRHLPARRAAGAAAPAGRDRAGAAADRDARRLRLAASPTGGASSCACAATTPAASTCSPTRARAC